MTDAEVAAQQVPRSLGPYQIEGEIGTGAMGTVFRAVHVGLDRPVALKVLRPDLLQDKSAVRRFLREGKAIARLEHPHIVSVYDAGEIHNIYFIAMKLLEGETLEAVTHEGRPPIDRVVRLASQMTAALHYAHGRGVIHRDVKPANVIIGEGDHATLTDFGIAQALYAGTARSTTIAGTPLYMSPEQIQGQEIDGRSDIYSLGAVLYELCTGRPPFEGQMVSVMYAHLHSPVPDIRELAPTVPESLAHVIERSLAKNPADRFQTAGEMGQALSRMGGEGAYDSGKTLDVYSTAGQTAVIEQPDASLVQERSTATSIAAPIPVAGRRLLPLGIGAAAIVVVAAAVLAFLVLRPSSAPAPPAPPAVGSLTITSQPPGASVTIDGQSRGHTPLNISSVHSGSHSLILSLATYQTKELNVNERGGKTVRLRVPLKSLPASQLLTVPSAILTNTFSTDPATHRVIPGAPVSVVTLAQATSKPIYVLAQFQLRKAVARVRGVRFVPSYTIFGPSGAAVGSSPAPPTVALTQQRPAQVWQSGFQLRLRSSASHSSAGKYTVNLYADGKRVKALSFTVKQ